ncbi:37677_t:CDS:2, partial [Gigaspora margarita]
MELDNNLYSQSQYYPLDPLSEDGLIDKAQRDGFEVNNNTDGHQPNQYKSRGEALSKRKVYDLSNSINQANNNRSLSRGEVSSTSQANNNGPGCIQSSIVQT